MKKIIYMFLIICLLLTGCKGSNAPSGQPQNEGGGPSTTLRLFLISSETPGKPITYTANSNLKDPSPIEEKIMSFLKKHRNVTIEVTTIALSTGYLGTRPVVRGVCFQESSDKNFDIAEFTPHQADI